MSTSSDVWAHETPVLAGRGGWNPGLANSRERLPRVIRVLVLAALCRAQNRRQLVRSGIKKRYESSIRKLVREEEEGAPGRAAGDERSIGAVTNKYSLQGLRT